MTIEQYNKSIETGELQLTSWDKFKYYFLPVLLFFASVVFLTGLFDGSKSNDKPSIAFIIVPAIVGSLFYMIQKSALKFQVVESNLSKNDLLLLMKNLSDEQKWSIVSQEGDVFIANSDFSAGRKTKKITVLFDGSKVFLNCIIDPDIEKSAPDLLGNNRETIKIIIDRLQSTQETSG